MFTKAIHETTLTSEAANRLFSNINAGNTPDQSFLSTLRALLHKRLPADKSVRLTCTPIYRTMQEISYATTSDCMNWFLPDAVYYPDATYNINIVYTVHLDAGAKMLEMLRANAGTGKRYLSDFFRVDELQVFFARKVNALFFRNPTTNIINIFTDKLEPKQFHALQIMIPKYLPELFAGAPLTETEIALLKSLGNKSAVEYETLIGGFSKDLDIRSEIIRIKLAGFETTHERIRRDEMRNEINRHQQDYDSYIASLQEVSQKIQNCQYILAGLESAINTQSGDSELVEYFMCNKNLTIINVVGTRLEFVAHGYVDVYDEEAFDQFAGNHGGYMYANLNPSVTKPQMEKLYRAIFNDGLYKLRICAAYTADMRTGLRAFQHYAFPVESSTYFPNPHIQQYGCIGTYAGRFQQYMQRKDYVGAIDQAVVSARNLNFCDSSVMADFAKNFSRANISCIEKPDGTLLTPREAILELEGGGDECHDLLF